MGGIVIAFGRMNPPTVGHVKVVNNLLDVSNDRGDDHLLILSRSQEGAKNPLSPVDKLWFLRQMVDRDFKAETATENRFSIVQWLIDLDAEYDDVTVVCGSDRAADYTRIMERYNGTSMDTSDPLFEYRSWEVIGLPRDDLLVSSTDVRRYVVDRDWDAFRASYDDGHLPDTLVRSLWLFLSDSLPINIGNEGHQNGTRSEEGEAS